VVKPVCDGSSLGVSIPKTRAEFLTAVAAGFAVADDLLIEEFIEGVEVTVPVLGNSGGAGDALSGAGSAVAGDTSGVNPAGVPNASAPPAAATPHTGSDRTPSAELLALPVIEIVPKNEFYDYESKYAEGGSEHIIPARISARETALCQRVAIEAHRALGCDGVSRTDIIVTPRGEACVIETNTIPGMTGTSLIPEDARKVGLTSGELYRLLMHYALQRTATQRTATP
jgi:D-alanine-D-alanine ligase